MNQTSQPGQPTKAPNTARDSNSEQEEIQTREGVTPLPPIFSSKQAVIIANRRQCKPVSPSVFCRPAAPHHPAPSQSSLSRAVVSPSVPTEVSHSPPHRGPSRQSSPAHVSRPSCGAVRCSALPRAVLYAVPCACRTNTQIPGECLHQPRPRLRPHIKPSSAGCRPTLRQPDCSEDPPWTQGRHKESGLYARLHVNVWASFRQT